MRIVLPTLMLAACSQDINHKTAALAGPDAIGCGTIEAETDPTAAWACAVDAFQAGSAFWIVEGNAGIDSIIWVGLAFDGAVGTELRQDSYRGGGPIDERTCADLLVVDRLDDEYDDDDVFGFPVIACN